MIREGLQSSRNLYGCVLCRERERKTERQKKEQTNKEKEKEILTKERKTKGRNQ